MGEQPACDEAATHKPWQLTLAERLGSRVPRTCITSDPARARAFVESVRPGRPSSSRSATRADWRATRLVRRRSSVAFDVVRYAPVIFQEYVEAGVDVRGHRRRPPTFATAIHVSDTDYPADFRVGFDQARVDHPPWSSSSRLRRSCPPWGSRTPRSTCGGMTTASTISSK